MVSFCSDRRVILGLLIFLTLAALFASSLLNPVPVGANGRVLELKRQTSGPYEIAMGTIPGSPVVGAFHMTLNVTDISSNTPILNANVTVAGVGPTDPEVPNSEPATLGPLQATNSPTDPIFYDINTVIEREGMWLFTIDVNADQGAASFEFPIEVVKASPITGIVTLLTLLIFVTILGLSVRAFLRERGRRGQTSSDA